MRRAWEVSDITDPADFAIAAYDKAIGKSKGRSFSREFAAFSAATAEWRTGTGGFRTGPCTRTWRARAACARARKKFRLDHTAIRLLDVRAAGNGPIELGVRADDGVRAGLALVARDGEPLSGAVTVKKRFLSQGGKGTVTLDSPARYERITAVVTNADGRVDGFGRADWDYRKDDQDFRVRLTG